MPTIDLPEPVTDEAIEAMTPRQLAALIDGCETKVNDVQEIQRELEDIADAHDAIATRAHQRLINTPCTCAEQLVELLMLAFPQHYTLQDGTITFERLGRHCVVAIEQVDESHVSISCTGERKGEPDHVSDVLPLPITAKSAYEIVVASARAVSW